MAISTAMKKCPRCDLVSSPDTNRGQPCEFCKLWEGRGLSPKDSKMVMKLFWEYWQLVHRGEPELIKFAGVVAGRAVRAAQTIAEFLRTELQKFPQCSRCEAHLPKNQKRPVCKDHRKWWNELDRRIGERFPTDGELVRFCRETAAPQWKELIGSDGAHLDKDRDTWTLFINEITPAIRTKDAAPPPARRPASAPTPCPVSPAPASAATLQPVPQIVDSLPTLGRKWTPGEKQWVYNNGQEVARLLSDPTPEEFSAILFWRGEHFQKRGVSGRKARVAGMEFLGEILPNIVAPKILAVRGVVTPSAPSLPAPTLPVAEVQVTVHREVELLLAKVRGLKSSVEGIVREIEALEERLQSLVSKGEA